MKIKELIQELQKYCNQDAEITIVSNTINADDDEYDIMCHHIECWGNDIEENVEMVEIFVTNQM